MKFRGGLTYGKSLFGASNFSWPFGFISFDSSFIRLGVGSEVYFNFDPLDLECIKVFRSPLIFNFGFRFIHSNTNDFPNYLVFWAVGSSAQILATLKKLRPEKLSIVNNVAIG